MDAFSTAAWSRRSFLKSAAMLSAVAVSGSVPLLSQSATTGSSEPSTSDIEALRKRFAVPKLTITPLADNLTMVSGDGGNIAVFSGPDGKLVIDSGVLSNAPKLIEYLNQIDSRPIHTVVNTHWHFDHTDGNEPLHNAGAEIVAHEKTLQRMSSPQFMEVLQLHFPAAPTAARPQKTFGAATTIKTNGETVEITHVDAAHTDSDAFLFFSKHNVLHSGDLIFAVGYPLIDYSTGGNINGMIAAAERMLKVVKDDTKIVPGHGPLQTTAQLRRYREVLETIRDRVAQAKSQGNTLEETQALKLTKDFDAERGKGSIDGDKFTMLVYRTL